MSRVAKSPVTIPKGVEVKLGADSIAVKGKNGSMSMPLHGSVDVKQEDGQLCSLRVKVQKTVGQWRVPLVH